VDDNIERAAMTWRCIFAITVVCATLGLAQAGPLYRLTQIGGPEVAATAINNVGQVTGSLVTPTGKHAFLWGAGVMTDLGSMAGYDAVGTAINDAGEIVGNLTPQQGTGSRPFLYSNGVMTVLPTLDAGKSWCCYGTANAINSSGQVGGSSGTSSSSTDHAAVIWTNEVPQPLPVSSSSSVHGLNDYGQATGHDATTGYGYLYSNGAATALNSLPAYCLQPFEPPCSSSGEAVNNALQVAGNYQIPDFDPPHELNTIAFHYANGVVQQLPTFPTLVPLTESLGEALAMNNAGQVAGRSGERGIENNQSAFLYSAVTDEMIDLNGQIDPADPLGSSITLNAAMAINDNGWVVALSYYPTLTATYLLTPVSPYPSALQVTSFPSTITVGSPFTVAWTDQSVTACTASGGSNDDGWGGSAPTHGGNQRIAENTAGSYHFTVTCTGASGPVTSTAAVTVNSPPPPSPQKTSGGGGGGALDPWYLPGLTSVLLLRRRRAGVGSARRRPASHRANVSSQATNS
jgi:probable HAF family extracellular repeat protein